MDSMQLCLLLQVPVPSSNASCGSSRYRQGSSELGHCGQCLQSTDPQWNNHEDILHFTLLNDGTTGRLSDTPASATPPVSGANEGWERLVLVHSMKVQMCTAAVNHAFQNLMYVELALRLN